MNILLASWCLYCNTYKHFVGALQHLVLYIWQLYMLNVRFKGKTSWILSGNKQTISIKVEPRHNANLRNIYNMTWQELSRILANTGTVLLSLFTFYPFRINWDGSMTNSSHKTTDRLNKLTAAHRQASVHPFTDAGF